MRARNRQLTDSSSAESAKRADAANFAQCAVRPPTDRRLESNPPQSSSERRNVRAMRVNEAAAAYGLSRATLYKLMARSGAVGGLRSVKIGGRRLIPVDALEALIAGDSP